MTRTTILLRGVYLLAATLLSYGLSQGIAAGQGPSATIQVDLQQKQAPVSPTLYGIFLEEISHAFDGGIYAELIQNRSFEEGVLPPGMKLVKKPDGALKMELEELAARCAEGSLGYALALAQQLRMGSQRAP